MMTNMGDFLDVLVDDAVDFAKDELENLVKEAKSDSNLFIRHIGELTEEFVKMRALGQINDEEFKELMDDLLDLNKMQYHKLAASSKVRAERIINGLSKMVIDDLLALI